MFFIALALAALFLHWLGRSVGIVLRIERWKLSVYCGEIAFQTLSQPIRFGGHLGREVIAFAEVFGQVKEQQAIVFVELHQLKIAQ